jgi:hypothetical protein
MAHARRSPRIFLHLNTHTAHAHGRARGPSVGRALCTLFNSAPKLIMGKSGRFRRRGAWRVPRVLKVPVRVRIAHRSGPPDCVNFSRPGVTVRSDRGGSDFEAAPRVGGCSVPVAFRRCVGTSLRIRDRRRHRWDDSGALGVCRGRRGRGWSPLLVRVRASNGIDFRGA